MAEKKTKNDSIETGDFEKEKDYYPAEYPRQTEKFSEKNRFVYDICKIIRDTAEQTLKKAFEDKGFHEKQGYLSVLGNGEKIGRGVENNEFNIRITSRPQTPTWFEKRIYFGAKQIRNEVNIEYDSEHKMVYIKYRTPEIAAFLGYGDEYSGHYMINEKIDLNAEDIKKFSNELKTIFEKFAKKEVAFLTNVKIGVEDKTDKSTYSMVDESFKSFKMPSMAEIFASSAEETMNSVDSVMNKGKKKEKKDDKTKIDKELLFDDIDDLQEGVYKEMAMKKLKHYTARNVNELRPSEKKTFFEELLREYKYSFAEPKGGVHIPDSEVSTWKKDGDDFKYAKKPFGTDKEEDVIRRDFSDTAYAQMHEHRPHIKKSKEKGDSFWTSVDLIPGSGYVPKGMEHNFVIGRHMDNTIGTKYPEKSKYLFENKMIKEMLKEVGEPIGGNDSNTGKKPGESQNIGKVSEMIPDIEKMIHFYNFSIRGNGHEFEGAQGDKMFNDLYYHETDKEFLQKYLKDFFGQSAENLDDYIDPDEFDENGEMEEFRIIDIYEVMFIDGGIIYLDFDAFDSFSLGEHVGEDSEMTKRYLPEFECKKWDMSIDELQKEVKKDGYKFVDYNKITNGLKSVSSLHDKNYSLNENESQNIGKVSEIIPDIEKVIHFYNFSIRGNNHEFEGAQGGKMFNDLYYHKPDKEFLQKYIKDFFGESAENLDDYIDPDEFDENGKMKEEFNVTDTYEVVFKDGGIIYLDFDAFDSFSLGEDVGKDSEMVKRYLPEFEYEKWDMSIDELQKEVQKTQGTMKEQKLKRKFTTINENKEMGVNKRYIITEKRNLTEEEQRWEKLSMMKEGETIHDAENMADECECETSFEDENMVTMDQGESENEMDFEKINSSEVEEGDVINGLMVILIDKTGSLSEAKYKVFEKDFLNECKAFLYDFNTSGFVPNPNYKSEDKKKD